MYIKTAEIFVYAQRKKNASGHKIKRPGYILIVPAPTGIFCLLTIRLSQPVHFWCSSYHTLCPLWYKKILEHKEHNESQRTLIRCVNSVGGWRCFRHLHNQVSRIFYACLAGRQVFSAFLLNYYRLIQTWQQ